jgi:excisionase family DNA binding protein
MPPLLTVREVATALRVQESTICRWARDGSIGALRVNGTVRIPADALERIARTAASDNPKETQQ